MLTLQESPLFTGLNSDDIEKLCTCLGAYQKEIKKDDFVFRAGDEVRNVYLILSGSMHIIDEDFWGNRSIIETMRESTFFDEAYVFAQNEYQLVSVIAAEDSVVLEMDPSALFSDCPNNCSCHEKLVQNIVYILSKKIILLTEKLGHVIQRSTREKVLSYLSLCLRKSNSNPFTIPYSRQQLADYLCVDRSALSHELGRLRDEGLIKFRKNQFEILNLPKYEMSDLASVQNSLPF